MEKDILGKVKAYVYVVEFQKRGLPHTHFLLIMCGYDMHHARVGCGPISSPWWPRPRAVGGGNKHSTTKSTKNDGSSYAQHHGHGGTDP